MKKKSNNIIKILLQSKRVNNYTKLMIILNTLDYYEDYYIPNRKLINMLGLTKCWIIELLHQLEEDEIIKVFYKGRKRYFTFIGKVKEDKKEDFDFNYYNNDDDDLSNYRWFEEFEEED